jgi:hypothetical protein
LDAIYPPLDEVDHDIDAAGFTPDTYYVLDGQQRLTSVARVFLDSHPNRNYYFDLKKMYELFDDETPSYIVSRARGKKNPERKDNYKLIRSDIVLDQKKCDVYISEYIEDSGDFPEFENNRNAAREAAAKIKGVFETIRKYLVPFVVLDNDAPLESVCRVFETINSTGTRLTTFDLAVARYYPDPDLKDLYDRSIEKYPVLTKFDVDGERVLQILSLYQLYHNGKFPEATRKVMLSLEPDFIKTYWNDATRYLAEAYDWIQQLGATPQTQPAHGMLVSIATLLMYHPGVLNSLDMPHILKKWYFCSTLAKTSSPLTNYKVGDDFRRFCEYLSNGSPIRYPIVYFSTEDIIDIKHIGDSRYKAIQGLMRTTVREDLITGNILNDVEDHHIYPYSLVKLNGLNKSKINSIANKIMLSQKSNRSISNVNPEKYFKDLANRYLSEGNIGDINRRLKNCLLPYKVDEPDFSKKFSRENFENFLVDRAQMIIDRIKEVVGDAWREPDLDSNLDENLEDDEYVTV